jgi:small subunit ribosomal protein S16
MLRIRFQRVGSKNQPAYRIVVIDQRQKRSGDVVENIGFHNPRTRPSTDQVDSARALHWLSVGAQPTDAAKSVLRRAGTWALFERLQKGEAKETILAEAANLKQADVSPKTSYPAPVGKAPVPAAKDAVDAAADA